MVAKKSGRYGNLPYVRRAAAAVHVGRLSIADDARRAAAAAHVGFALHKATGPTVRALTC